MSNRTRAYPPTTEAVATMRIARSHSLGRRMLTQPSVILGGGIVLAWALVALTWPLWTQDPLATDGLGSFQPPGPEHWLGTDSLGRDVFARTMAGSSSSLLVGPSVMVVAMLLGTVLGGIAGYLGGLWDEVIMRTMDVLLAFPSIIVAIILLGLFNSDITTLIVVLSVFFTPLVARTVRSAVMGIRTKEYIDAALLRGERTPHILVAEVVPNILPTLLVEATIRLSTAVVASASLSFIGVGVQPPTPDWGLSIATEAPYLSIAWWPALMPSFALASLVIGVALLADGISHVKEN